MSQEDCNGICLLFSLLYLPDVGCFLFRFYNSSAALLTLYFPYLLWLPIGLFILKFADSFFATLVPFRQPYALLLVLLD